MHSGVALSPREHATFSVISRLISCFVTEKILRAFWIPFEKNIQGASGIMVVLSTHTISEDANIYRALRSDDIFVIIPLHHPPVIQGEMRKHGQLIGLVDPLDMLPLAYEFRRGEELNEELVPSLEDNFGQFIINYLAPPPWVLGKSGSFWRISNPVSLWSKFVDGIVMPDDFHDVISQEIQSSLDWQTIAYKNPPSCPSLNSPSIKWEQSLVAGHPTHPMHRARILSNSSLEYDWYHPRIRFVRVPRFRVAVLGQFEQITEDLARKAVGKTGRIFLVDDAFLYMPVHELQVENIRSKFEDAEVLDPDVYLPSLAQSGIRTVILPDFPGIALKLSIGVKISSALRTISHYTADFGPRFSREIVPKLAVNPDILSFELEPSSAVYRTPNPEVEKHFTAIIREEYRTPPGEVLIVCAALLETDHAGVAPGVSAVEHTFMLDNEEKKAHFLDRYIKVVCEALIPPLLYNGVALEAHAQNVLARFDVATKELRGFVFRDLGGLRIHPPTLRESTGVDFQFIPGHCVVTETLEETFPKFYHTFVHNHIQRLIRLLGLHYNGRGWEMLRKSMGSVIPKDHPVWKVWMDPASMTVNSKCLMRMRMRDSYRDMVYSPYPNMIQYRPQNLGPISTCEA